MSNDLMKYDEQWAEQAQRVAASEPPVSDGAQWISCKAGVMMLGETPMPGNQCAVIVVDSIRENTYYEGKYDPNNPQPPVCYALGRGLDPMFPHTSMQQDPTYFKPQHIVDGQVSGCEQCPMAEWGSADTGKGKACQQRRRLVLLPAGYYTPRRGSRDFDLELFEEASHFAQAETANLKLPVTSVKNWGIYVNQLIQSTQRPFYGVLTRIYVEPHPKHQFEVKFEMLDLVPDSLAQTIMDRAAAEQAKPLTGYVSPNLRQD